MRFWSQWHISPICIEISVFFQNTSVYNFPKWTKIGQKKMSCMVQRTNPFFFFLSFSSLFSSLHRATLHYNCIYNRRVVLTGIVRWPLSTPFFEKKLSFFSIYVTFSVYRYYFKIFFTFSDKYFLFFLPLTITAWCWLTFSIKESAHSYIIF